ERFGVHPALFDAALHAASLVESVGDAGQIRLPFAWSGVRLDGVGAATARVRVRPVGDASAEGNVAVGLQVADVAGHPVASVESLVLRTLSEHDLDVTSNPLFRLD